MRIAFCATLALTLLALPALAQPQMDGSARDVLYGTAVSIQDGQTGYGNATIGRPDICNGSELDAAYGVVYNGRLYLVFAGNFETNGNRLQIFLDTRSGGQNRLVANNPDKGSLLRMGPGAEGPGLKFASDFNADYYVSAYAFGDPVVVHADYAELYDATHAPTPVGYYLGFGELVCGGQVVLGGGDTGGPAIGVALNNSNVLGVTGGFYDDYGGGVLTGFEFSIPLAAIGNPTGEIYITAFIGSGDAVGVSNQVLGGLAGILNGNIAGGQTSDYWTDVRLVDLSDANLYGIHQPFAVQMANVRRGACCTGQTCNVLPFNQCSGVYKGDNTSCDGNPCDTTPSGRCCIDDGYSGQCAVMTQAECNATPGHLSWTINENCTGCPCLLEPMGACCVSGSCEQMREAHCLAASGVYAGDFTNCETPGSSPCDTGACCNGLDCHDYMRFQCTGLVTFFVGVPCSSDPCAAPTIAVPSVAGDFNGWNSSSDPMTETAPGSRIWTKSYTLDPNTPRHLFKITNGNWPPHRRCLARRSE